MVELKKIKIHSSQDFEKMFKVGQLAAMILDKITEFVKPGVTTNYLNDLCHKFIIDCGAIPAPLNYHGFPKSICTSINEVVCHGIPSNEKLKNGDIVNIDVTLIFDGWHGDTSRMFCVGKVSQEMKNLVQVTYDAMMAGIDIVRPGNKLGDIGYIIQQYARRYGYSVVRDYGGHGIGKVFHDEPMVLHYGKAGTGVELKEGMFFTVEPMINIGSFHTILDFNDKWTVRTMDNLPSAQFEHTIGVTKSGYRIFTESPKKFLCPPYEL